MNLFNEHHDDTGQGHAGGEPGSRMEAIRNRLGNLIELADRLERVERCDVPICANYHQALVRNVMRALAQDLPAAMIESVLHTHPGVAEVHENMHYATAGLLRAPPALALASKAAAAACLARWVRTPTPSVPKA